MKKIILLIICSGLFLHAGFLDSIGEVVESTLSSDKLETRSEVTTVGTLSTSHGIRKHEDNNSMNNTIDVVNVAVKIKKDNSYFGETIMDNMVNMIGLEADENLKIPSIFEFNVLKEKKVSESTMLDYGILDDIGELGTTLYRGLKYTGESTEFMSGVMYKSSKIYNNMFDVFDNSPFNIFDDKDKRNPSIFDVFNKGNSILDFLN